MSKQLPYNPNLDSLLRGGQAEYAGPRQGRFAWTPSMVFAAPSTVDAEMRDSWWWVSHAPAEGAPNTIHVNEGVVHYYDPDSGGYPDNYGHLPAAVPLAELFISADDFEVEDNDELYLVIDWSAEPAATTQADTGHRLLRLYDPVGESNIQDLVTEDGGPIVTGETSGHTHTIDTHSHTISVALGTGFGDVSSVVADLRNARILPDTVGFEIFNSTKTNTRTTGYIHIASFTVVNDVLSIKRHVFACPIILPPYAEPYGTGIGD